MDLTTFYSRLREINRDFRTVEEELRERGVLSIVEFGDLQVEGIGVVIDSIPKHLDLQLSRRFRKRGKVLFFDALVKNLEKYKEHVVFFVSSVSFGSKELELPKHFGVLYAEFQRYPERVIRRFPAWEVVRGSVRVGRKEYRLRGVMRVPTYSKYHLLFVAHPEDVEREVIPSSRKDVVKEIIFPLQEIIERYRYSPVRNRIVTNNIFTTPLFSVEIIKECERKFSL